MSAATADARPITFEDQTWFDAAKYYLSSRSEVGFLVRVFAFFGLISIPEVPIDIAGDFVPGLDFFTILDTFPAVGFAAIFGVISVVRIRAIRKRANETHTVLN
jgi:hypothetical protein